MLLVHPLLALPVELIIEQWYEHITIGFDAAFRSAVAQCSFAR